MLIPTLRRWLVVLMALTVAACSPTAAPYASVPTPGPAVPTMSAAPTGAPAAAVPSPGAGAPERVEGTIQSLADAQLTLSNGRSFSVPATVRVQRSTLIQPNDLKSGDYVAVTAKRQPDNTLVASIVNVFPPSIGQVAPGQRPLPEGNLMTNATIDQVQGNTFTVTFPGGGARVQLAPDARITRTLDASMGDLHPGLTVLAQVADGAVRSITIEPSATG